MPWVSILLLATNPWVLATGEPELIEIQQDIARADGIGGYYDTTYRPLEPSFWARIPGWMREDAAERKVERILDIGCGKGFMLHDFKELMPDATVRGLFNLVLALPSFQLS